MRIEIGCDEFNLFHERWSAVSDIFQRLEQIVSKPLGAEHGNLILRT